MWDFLTRWAWRRRRALFLYFDGIRQRYVDPTKVITFLREHPEFNWGTHPKMMATGDQEAIDITTKAARQAFALPEVDPSTGDGLTDPESLAVFAGFCEYLVRQKKTTESPRSLPRFTGSGFSGESTSKRDSGSGSTSTSVPAGSRSP